MKSIPLTPPQSDQDRFRQIATHLTQVGYAILPAILPEALIDALLLHVQSLSEAEFQQAGTGRDLNYQVDTLVRGDEIRWLEGSHPATRTYLDWIETLRLSLNRQLFLGLFDYECHYAYYPVGSFYRKHLDAFRGSSNRVLSTVLYLNPLWEPDNGGELQIYSPDDELLATILPDYGTMVLFLSEVFPHAVLPVQKPRYSIAGWFRINTNLGANLDPPC